MGVTFEKASTEEDVERVFNYNIGAFVDAPDFDWGLPQLKEQLKDQWELYGVFQEKEIIAAVLTKVVAEGLLTKNTGIKITHQGVGISHQIKDFFELKARDLGLNVIYHYCLIDDFRMYSLNEKHGYKKTGKSLGKNGEVVEWEKNLP
jgi:hypothetical protein